MVIEQFEMYLEALGKVENREIHVGLVEFTEVDETTNETIIWTHIIMLNAPYYKCAVISAGFEKQILTKENDNLLCLFVQKTAEEAFELLIQGENK